MKPFTSEEPCQMLQHIFTTCICTCYVWKPPAPKKQNKKGVISLVLDKLECFFVVCVSELTESSSAHIKQGIFVGAQVVFPVVIIGSA